MVTVDFAAKRSLFVLFTKKRKNLIFIKGVTISGHAASIKANPTRAGKETLDASRCVAGQH